MGKTIIRSPGGTARREVDLDTVQVPDLWHLAMWLENADGDRTKKKVASEETMKAWGDMVLETWGLCHDLLWNLREGN